MRRWRAWGMRMAALFGRRRRERELCEEMESHLALHIEDNLRAGMDFQEARRQALVKLGGLEQTKERYRERRGIPQVETVFQDVRYGLRMLRKSPGFTAVAVLTLALGIGANTAAFTIVNTLLLHPLPVKDASRLVAMKTELVASKAQGRDLRPISFLNLQDFVRENRSFVSLAGYSSTLAATMGDKNDAQRVFVQVVTPNYFETLGLLPTLGRFFSSKEDVAPGSDPVVVLGYAAWQSIFGGSPQTIGRTILLNQTPFTIVGIAPKGFLGVSAVFGPDMWLPTMMAGTALPRAQQNALMDRSLLAFTGAARLEPGVSLERAEENMKTVAARLAREYPSADEGQTVSLQTITQAAIGANQGAAGFTAAGVLLMVVVTLVLLIACSNVANLLLARGVVRRHEMALRVALGAGRGRLTRQLLIESLLFNLLAAVLALFFAYAGCRLLWSLRPAAFARNLASLKLDPVVFVYTLLVAVFAGVLLGIAPALQSARVAVIEVLKDQLPGASGSPSRLKVTRMLLVGQVAVSLVLLVTTALVLRSLGRQYSENPGFQTAHLALFLLYPSQAGYGKTQTEQFYEQVSNRATGLPGVVSVSWASNLPFWAQPQPGLSISGRETRAKSEAISSVVNTVSPDYFGTMDIALLAGRDFTPEDDEGAAPVAIINETLANRYWFGGSAVGQVIQAPGETVHRRIVGIVRTVDYASIGEPPQPCVYIPLRQHYADTMVLYVRAAGAPQTAIATMRAELRGIAPELPIQDVRTGTEVIRQVLWGTQIGVSLLGVFGLLALGLASVGLYGVVAYSVNQRRREVAIRMALGATPASVVRLVVRQAMTIVLTGAAAGLVLSAFVGRGLSRFLYGISTMDLPSLAASLSLLLMVALLACYIPARRAMRVDPMVSLRFE